MRHERRRLTGVFTLWLVLAATLAGCDSSDRPAPVQPAATVAAPAPKPFDAVPERRPDGASQFAPVHGALVHFKSWGQGREALVFIHGWACDMGVWRDQQPEFAKTRRVVLLDLPGHGQSGKPEDMVYSMETFADAVEAVLKEAGVDRAVLAGHSMGFPVARWLGLKRPGLVKAVVSVDGAVLRFPKEGKELEKAREKYAAFVAPFKEENCQAHAAAFIDSLRGEKTPPLLAEEIKTRMLATPCYVMAGAMEQFVDPAYWPEASLDVPALAVYAKSPHLESGFNQYLKFLLPRVEYQEWQGAGHFLMLEEPTRFNQVLADFLKRQSL